MREKATLKPVSTEKKQLMKVNGKAEWLPEDPFKTVQLLRARRSTKTPAGKLRDRISADLRKRGLA